jgi:hypothetical protein
MFATGYPVLLLSTPWVSVPLLLALIGIGTYAWRVADSGGVLATLVLAASLLAPQRATYETAVLVVPLVIALRRPYLVMGAVACSWPFLLPLFGDNHELRASICLLLPGVLAIALAVLPFGKQRPQLASLPLVRPSNIKAPSEQVG